MTFMRLYVTAASLTARAARVSARRAGQVETGQTGAGAGDNMRHSVASESRGCDQEKWNYCETRGQRCFLCSVWDPGTLQSLKMRVWNIWNTCESDYVKLHAQSVSMFSLWLLWRWFKLCTTTVALLRLPRPLCYKAGLVELLWREGGLWSVMLGRGSGRARDWRVWRDVI